MRTDAHPREPLSRLEIDLAALHRNVEAVRSLVGPGVVICGVVKKNAYGLGAVPVAHRMVKAGCGMVSVYGPEEAEQLIQGAVTAQILLLYPLRHLGRTDLLYRPASSGKLHLTVHDPEQLDALDAIGRTFGIRLPVHLYIDTGMSRSGLSVAEFADALASQANRKYLRLAGIMTHLATADNDPAFAAVQVERFDALLEQHRAAIPADATVHLANSYATLRAHRYHRAMVRPGLMLFGYGPSDLAAGGDIIDPLPKLSPVLRWVSRLIHVQEYPPGSRVGYGATHTLQRPSTIGIVPVGYGDGYPLGLSNCSAVRVSVAGRWHDAPVLGRVNMDQLTVDLTDIDAARDTLHDAEVEVYGNDPGAVNALPRLAGLAGSHCYELLCRLGADLPRQYAQ